MVLLKLTDDEATELYEILEEALGDIACVPCPEPEDEASRDKRLASCTELIDMVATAIALRQPDPEV